MNLAVDDEGPSCWLTVSNSLLADSESLDHFACINIIFFLFLHKNICYGYISMSMHNICFCGEIRKSIGAFWLKNRPYLEL